MACGAGVSPNSMTDALTGPVTGGDDDAGKATGGSSAHRDAAGAVDAEIGADGAAHDGVVGPITIRSDAALPAADRVLAVARGILADTKSTFYDHVSFIDESTGAFDLDCSGFTNFVIQQASSGAYETLVGATTPRPLARGYATFMAYLPPGGDGAWHHVATAMDFVPGDVIAWIEPPQLQSVDTGHTMIVASPPVMTGDGVVVDILDSTDTGHGSTDPRTIAGTSGVGHGAIVLLVDSAGAPTGYRWSPDPGVLSYTTTVGLGHLE